MKTLVIVESPTKAKTISRYLGKDFIVESSYGHIRDLPKKEIGVDTEHDFKPKYVIPAKAKKVLKNLKAKAGKVDEVILATDEDREGEAIAWHLSQVLNIDPASTKRIVFHEITDKAIKNALKSPRSIDNNLVDAQQARRVLDRLVGYKLSPLLWNKVRRGLSAGRVQSVAVRLIVDREREIENFNVQEYWSIEAKLAKNEDIKNLFTAKLIKNNNKLLKKLELDKKLADNIINNLKGAQYKIIDIRKKEIKRNPAPPFITSTLQQEASRKFGFSAKQTMVIAQQLYEGINIDGQSTGLISYMRTDSYNLSKDALSEAQKVIKDLFGEQYALESPRYYKKKSKGAQEAHEAIRPTSLLRYPDKIKKYLDPRQFKLYSLIWKRTIACQMQQAIMDSTAVDIEAKNYLFRATGSTVKFAGFIKVYTESTDDGKNVYQENYLPQLTLNEILKLIDLKSNQHFTEPPARYTDATLVKALEEYGIGRPSTYAPTISTIQDRGYVEKIDKKFHPLDIGKLVNDILVKHFANIVDFDFTAKLEEDLDDIALDKKEWTPIISNFYQPFIKNIKSKDKELDKKELTEEKTDKKCPECKNNLVIKMGRFGKFYACSNYPDCKYTEPLEAEKKELEKIEKEQTKEVCEKCGAAMEIKRGRFGPFLACSKYPECKNTKAIEKTTGAKCPECGKGEIIEKRTKRGRIFYACNQYPKCKNAMWQKPTGKNCPQCKKLLVYAAKDKIKCSNKECDFEK